MNKVISRWPTFSLINARSPVSRIDELSACLEVNNIDIAAITETWFNKDIDDDLVSLDKYCIHRCDRVSGCGGGVCLFVANTIYSKRLSDLEDTRYDCIWIWLRSNRLFRPLFSIAVCVVYNQPDRGMQ